MFRISLLFAAVAVISSPTTTAAAPTPPTYTVAVTDDRPPTPEWVDKKHKILQERVLAWGTVRYLRTGRGDSVEVHWLFLDRKGKTTPYSFLFEVKLDKEEAGFLGRRGWDRYWDQNQYQREDTHHMVPFPESKILGDHRYMESDDRSVDVVPIVGTQAARCNPELLVKAFWGGADEEIEFNGVKFPNYMFGAFQIKEVFPTSQECQQ